MKTAKLYKADGTIEDVSPTNGTDFSLAELQKFVGGTIDIQDLPETSEIIVVNDNGRLEDLPRNELATAVWKKAYPIEKYPHNNSELIVGDVVVCEKDMIK